MAVKGDGCSVHENLVECDWLSTCQVGESKTQHTTIETHPDRIAQRDILGIYGLTTVGDGSGIAPTGHPFGLISHFFCYTYYFVPFLSIQRIQSR
jgi:hypothetical protein